MSLHQDGDHLHFTDSEEFIESVVRARIEDWTMEDFVTWTVSSMIEWYREFPEELSTDAEWYLGDTSTIEKEEGTTEN